MATEASREGKGLVKSEMTKTLPPRKHVGFALSPPNLTRRATSHDLHHSSHDLGEADSLYFADALQNAHLRQSTRDLRDNFLNATTSASRYVNTNRKASTSTSSIDHPYGLHHSVHLKVPTGGEESSRLSADRPSKIFDLMSSFLSSDPPEIQQSIVNHIEYTLARSKWNFDDTAAYNATAYSVRDRLIELWNDTQEYYFDNAKKWCCYMSIEYLTGRSLQNAINNMGLHDPYHTALSELGYDLENVYDMEHDAALGNGGLGRLAACFLDSMATLNLPAWGYGLRYRYGMFKQGIADGFQVETPDYWLGQGNPWELPRLDKFYPIRFYGTSHPVALANGHTSYKWEGGEVVYAQAYDYPIPGYRTRNVINLRLWESKPATELDFSSFNSGDYYNAIDSKLVAEQITSVLYPNDSTYQGKELRLKQQYFFASATLQDILDRIKKKTNGNGISTLHDIVSIQLNDTHPTVSILELLRILLDIEGVEWDAAWNITTHVFSYTNHTILPEAMEKWELPMFQNLLPRHTEILFEVNRRFMEYLESRYPGDDGKKSRLSIVEESTPKRIRMAHLAIIGSHTVNGVAYIHSEILKNSLFREFSELWPTKFTNVTNGVTPRRWIDQSNPSLSELITTTLGNDKWLQDLRGLTKLKDKVDDAEFQKSWEESKLFNKTRLALFISKTTGIHVSSEALFDIQIKRIHEYKRQLLNILGVIHRYQTLKAMSPEQRRKQVKRVSIFGGKAAPGYLRAKAIIKLINQVGVIVNNDPDIGDLLKVVFLANYNVSLAELVVSASDISEHISTAGTEASGTSNMKFAMNGGLILGTLDGANIEIKDAIGTENMFVFGATAEQVDGLRYAAPIDARLYSVLQAISRGDFGHYNEFNEAISQLWDSTDYYLVAKDFPAYLKAQAEVDELWKNRSEWTKRSILTTAGMESFSSDRSIHQYAKNIWHIEPCPLPFPENAKVNLDSAVRSK